MASVSCPSCGAPLELKTKSALVVVCSFCDSTLMRQDMKLEDVGKMAELQEDGSPIQIGATGKFKDVGFEVIGRIQLQYDAGFWNEWYLSYRNGQMGWLGDGMGLYTASFLVEPTPAVPPFAQLKPGRTVTIQEHSFEVSEVSQARCIAGAGELPFEVRTGYDLPVADLAGEDTLFATIDYSEDPPLVFVGERVTFDELSLQGLREFEGW